MRLTDISDNIFVNYYLIEAKVKIFCFDEEDAINSQIFLKSNLSKQLKYNEVVLEDIEILKEEHFIKSHYVKTNNFCNKYLQKVRDGEKYYYRSNSNSLHPEGRKILNVIDHVTIDGDDYIDLGYVRYKIFKIEDDHFADVKINIGANALNGLNPTCNMKNLDYDYQLPEL